VVSGGIRIGISTAYNFDCKPCGQIARVEILASSKNGHEIWSNPGKSLGAVHKVRHAIFGQF